ncbi:hypothetical protein G6O69_14455 [Pseudenhygromyxa sp. WMMC2535]|uniref:hypothetical protein n=1 Tax=Pseudenhygromyxa sp. WMMC2535 TaxID=2712867 RepID=UPI001553306A|nr:hypothetical protein [Pseudenhygromyxa sp. WMMC2535]NVB39041.1 hypothetical protein [Pseudenhygromyxa sp. WMMC2535]
MNINTAYLTDCSFHAYDALTRIIEENAGKNNLFKIGMSVAPVRRVTNIRAAFNKPRYTGKMNITYRWGVGTLYILYYTEERYRCQNVERSFITHLKNIAGKSCLNATGGGGGRPGTGTHFVYLAHGHLKPAN